MREREREREKVFAPEENVLLNISSVMDNAFNADPIIFNISFYSL